MENAVSQAYMTGFLKVASMIGNGEVDAVDLYADMEREYRKNKIKDAIKNSLIAGAVGGIGSFALSHGDIPAGLIGAGASGLGTFALNMI